jgi:hypothetical protein
MVYIPKMSREALHLNRARLQGFFEKSAKKAFNKQDLTRVFAEEYEALQLPEGLRFTKFLELLLTETKLREVTLKSENYPDREETRFVWGSPSVYSLALSLRKNSYLSHGSAVFLHGLNDQIPKTVYLNCEQSPKPRLSGTLTQEGIDRAMSKSQRESQFTFKYGDSEIVIVNGKATDRLEVSSFAFQSETLEVTKLERTLIDIVVRPSYAGGIFQVLEAFERARSQVSVNTLVATLKKLDYLYPYHQAIGFYMEKAGYEESKWSKLLKLGIPFDFYLAYNLPEDKQLDPKWRLYYPSGF